MPKKKSAGKSRKRTHCRRGHLLAETQQIKPDGQRQCRVCRAMKASEWRKKQSPEKIALYKIKDNYGLTPEQYYALLEAQGHVCAICGGNRGSRKLCVDHDHVSEEVRGLLCSYCNTGLGMFKDNVEWLMAAIAYLEAFNARVEH